MNKLLKIVVPLLVLFIVALIYTRPQTIEQRWELPDFSECSQISGRYYIYDEADDHDKVDTEFVITPDDPAFDELLGLVKEAGFKTRLRNLLPSGTKYHSYREGDFRWEVYLYFDMEPDAFVMHFMGEPTETRHIIMRNEQAVISPSWSIHSGAGSRAYTFIWGMVGENQDFDDMDDVRNEDLL